MLLLKTYEYAGVSKDFRIPYIAHPLDRYGDTVTICGNHYNALLENASYPLDYICKVTNSSLWKRITR